MVTDRVIFVCTVIIAVVYLYATTLIPSLEIGDPLGPKAFPRLLGIILLIAAAMLALEMWRDRAKSASARGEGPKFESKVLAVLGCVTVWTGIYYVAFNPLGYIIATAIFLLPMMVYFNRGKWVANVLSAVLFSALTYWMFVKLDVNLPKGVLPF